MQRFERFSSMHSLTRVISTLIHKVKTFKQKQSGTCKGSITVTSHGPLMSCLGLDLSSSKLHRKSSSHMKLRISHTHSLSRNSALCKLKPILREDPICVGGRFEHGDLSAAEKNPIILPKKSHISLLLVRQYHEQVKHQGHHFTEGALRVAGYWVIGQRWLIASVLHKCVICRQLHWKVE